MRNLLLLLCLVSSAAAQYGRTAAGLTQDTLATVGSHVITTRDFLERFELMPWPNKDNKARIEATKRDFLHSLMAEKLLAMEATAQNLGNDPLTLRLQQNLEKLFVRDELYKTEVTSRIVITPEETREGMKRFPAEVEVVMLGIINQKDGDLLYKKVAAARNKRAVLWSFEDSLFVPLDTFVVKYGFKDRKVEDAVFALGKDSLTKPVQTEPFGTVMFYLLRRSTNMENAKFNTADRMHKVNNIIKDRKEDSIAVKFFASVTSPQRAEADPAVFFRMADSAYAILRRDSAELFGKGLFQFSPVGTERLRGQIADILDQPFISIATGPMTVQQVLDGLVNNNVVFPAPLETLQVRAVLNNNIKTVIQNEMLAREGLRRNLQQSAAVRHDIAVWMDNYRSARMLRAVLDTLAPPPDTLTPVQKERYRKEAVDAFIGELADRYGAAMREEALRNLSTTTTNMSTWRHIGFGGRILGVPQTRPQVDWIYERKKQDTINQ
ncbi:MAG: hypothetical protein HUU02_09090 [Bacteroidetes bacterium]|nr:hypothetical protein [Bacteroidota bacterium]